MAKRFEELECWKKAVELDAAIFNLVINSNIRNEFALRNQMLRSVGSIADNIAEGFERGGNKEFLQFLFISKGSAGELRSQLARGKVRGLIHDKDFTLHHELCLSISAMISGLINYLKKSDMKGEKFTKSK